MDFTQGSTVILRFLPTIWFLQSSSSSSSSDLLCFLRFCSPEVSHKPPGDLGLGTEQSRRPAKSHSANPHPRLSNLVDNHQERWTGGEASWKMWIGKAFGENLVAGAEAVYLSVPHKIFRNFYRHLSPLFLWKPISGFSFVETNLGLN